MRVLVVDDSTLFRKVVRDALASEPGVDVVGAAANGHVALQKILDLKPDVVTLDVEMPEADGLDVLRELRKQPSPPIVLMISSLTRDGAEMTTKALRLGAMDFIVKPEFDSLEAIRAQLQAELLPHIRLIAQRQGARVVAPRPTAPAAPAVTVRQPLFTGPSKPPQIVALGISTGGPAALSVMMPRLPASLPAPMVIVQHMPPIFTRSLADDLNRCCQIRVREGEAGEPIRPGVAYVAPGGKQMRLAPTADGPVVELTDDPPEKSCRPSADYLFRSVAQLYGARALGVIMTGMGDDGMLGCRALKAAGARVIAQDQASSVVYGMPRAVVDAELADVVSPLDEMHRAIMDTFAVTGAVCR
jgi:two-component system chemotaxis response regulator CheB